MKLFPDTLAFRSFAANRIRNLSAILAIMLTAVLFTTVTTIGKGAKDSLTLTQQMMKMSKSDGDFRYLTSGQFKKLEDAEFIRDYGLRMPVAYLADTDRHNIEFSVLDDTQAELNFCTPSHGASPKKADEIAASDLALRELGINPKVGAKVPVRFSLRGKTYNFEMTVSGWYEASNDQVSVLWAGTAFRDAHPDIFRYIYDKDREMAGTYWSDFTAVSSRRLKEKMDEWVISAGGNPEDSNAGNYVCAAVNTVTNASVSPRMMGMGAVIGALFILCGYLLIYNVFDIAVMQEIRRYGLYRTIGMSRKQVKRLLNLQALWLTGIGIPLGLFIGFFVGKATLPMVMDAVSSEYENLTVNVTPSPVIFLGAATLTALTVFLSTRKPVRIAANTPPMEAYRFVEVSGSKKRTRRRSLDARLTRMARANLGRNKRRTAFIMLSLTLSIALLNSVGIAAASYDIEKQVDYMIRTDFGVVNKASTNILEGFTRREQGLKTQTIEDISRQPGVYGGCAIYKNTLDDTDVTYDFGAGIDEFWTEKDPDGEEILYGVSEELDGLSAPVGTDRRFLCNVYGMSEAALSRMDIKEGITDAKKLYRKMQKGEGVLVGVMMDRSSMGINKDFDVTEIGGTVTVYKNGKAFLELPILAKAAQNGDDEEIGSTLSGAAAVGGDAARLYLPCEIYKKIYDNPTVYKYSFDVKEENQADMTAFLEDYIRTKDTSLNYLSAENTRKSAEKNRWMIAFVGGMIGVIFGIIGVLNLVNTLITAIITRRHEFATMQSIGMTDRQLTRMMTFEGLYYAAGACALGILTSVLLGFTAVRELTGAVWLFRFRFTLAPALITCAVLMVSAALIPAAALRAFNRGSIVEKLRVAE